jgi:hypothetical protein
MMKFQIRQIDSNNRLTDSVESPLSPDHVTARLFDNPLVRTVTVTYTDASSTSFTVDR